MTEDEIERTVERRFDKIDRWLMIGDVNQAEYDGLAKRIHEWAERQRAS